MEHKAINLNEKYNKFSDQWKPKIIAQFNTSHIKVAKVEGDYHWHSHADTDQVFMVIEGELRMDLRDGSVDLKAGELYVVPKGVEHKPYAAKECRVLLLDPAGIVKKVTDGDSIKEEEDWI